jgi:hypothetical protein
MGEYAFGSLWNSTASTRLIGTRDGGAGLATGTSFGGFRSVFPFTSACWLVVLLGDWPAPERVERGGKAHRGERDPKDGHPGALTVTGTSAAGR